MATISCYPPSRSFGQRCADCSRKWKPCQNQLWGIIQAEILLGFAGRGFARLRLPVAQFHQGAGFDVFKLIQRVSPTAILSPGSGSNSTVRLPRTRSHTMEVTLPTGLSPRKTGSSSAMLGRNPSRPPLRPVNPGVSPRYFASKDSTTSNSNRARSAGTSINASGLPGCADDA